MSGSTLHSEQALTNVIGYATPASVEASDGSQSAGEALRQLNTSLYVISDDSGPRIVSNIDFSASQEGDYSVPVLGNIPAMSPRGLGDPTFCADHGIRYPYVAGAMANGIASVEFVEALSRAGMLGFFGAAGLAVSRVEESVDRLIASLGDAPFGVNLIHSPNESAVEMAVANLLLDRGVHLVEASAFLKITQPIVKYRLTGLHRDADGRVVAPNHIVAKVSREELAEKFLSPAPEKIVGKLLEAGEITAEEAELSKSIPMAQDISAEADSGGHTDHRPALALLPTLLSLRDRMEIEHGYDMALRIGLGGGISTPASALAAFAMGAAYVVTGSVNQACQESGTSDIVRGMLAETRQADVAKAPAADMFEMGVTVQVVKRGTMFAMRGNKLYELYRVHASMDEISTVDREKLEKQTFRATLEETWASTRAFWQDRDPKQVERAEREPKHKMALVFRSYLGLGSVWANSGVEDRKMDYQIWCGPAMGAFNEWVRGSFMDEYKQRHADNVAKNILYGTTVLSRVQQARNLGLRLAPEDAKITPLQNQDLEQYFVS